MKRTAALCAGILLPALLTACSGSDDELAALAGRISSQPGGQVVVVDVQEVRDETGSDLSVEDLDELDDQALAALNGMDALPFLQLKRLTELFRFPDMTGYASSGEEIILRFALSTEQMRERLEQLGFDAEGNDRYVAGDQLDSTETQLAPALGLAEDGDGVLVAIGAERSVVDRLLDADSQNEDVTDLLDLDEATRRSVYPSGLPVDSDCSLMAITQEISGERTVSVYLDDVEEDELADTIDSAVRGDVEAVEEVDGLVAVRVRPDSEGLMGAMEILTRLGLAGFCA